MRHWRQAPHADPTPRSGSDTAAGGLRVCEWRRVPDGWDGMESVGLSWKHASFFPLVSFLLGWNCCSQLTLFPSHQLPEPPEPHLCSGKEGSTEGGDPAGEPASQRGMVTAGNRPPPSCSPADWALPWSQLVPW